MIMRKNNGKQHTDTSSGAERAMNARRIIPSLQWVESAIATEISVVGQQQIIYRTR